MNNIVHTGDHDVASDEEIKLIPEAQHLKGRPSYV